MAVAADNMGDDCNECKECDDMTSCIKSIRHAVGYMADILSKMMEANIRVNKAIMNLMQSKIKKDTEPFEGFYS